MRVYAGVICALVWLFFLCDGVIVFVCCVCAGVVVFLMRSVFVVVVFLWFSIDIFMWPRNENFEGQQVFQGWLSFDRFYGGQQ